MGKYKISDAIGDMLIDVGRIKHQVVLMQDHILNHAEVISLLEDTRQLLLKDFRKALDTTPARR